MPAYDMESVFSGIESTEKSGYNEGEDGIEIDKDVALAMMGKFEEVTADAINVDVKEDDHDPCMSKRNKKIGAALLLVVAALAIVLPIILFTGSSSSDGNEEITEVFDNDSEGELSISPSVSPGPSHEPSELSISPSVSPGPSHEPSINPTKSMYPSVVPTDIPSIYPSSSPTCIDSQKCALENLYYSTSGGKWLNSENWLLTSNVCEWYGVECMDAFTINKIDLSANGLEGKIPGGDYFWKGLSSLMFLDLSENSLSGSIPKEISALSSLMQLEIDSNEITGQLPSEIGELKNLQILAIQNNEMHGTIASDGAVCDLTKNSLFIFTSDCSPVGVICDCCSKCYP